MIEPRMCPLKIEKSNFDAVVSGTKASLTVSIESWEKQVDVKDSSQSKLLVIDEIVRQCEEADFPIDVAMTIAECESGFNQYAKNPNSSARGIYQFISGTFLNYCEGDVFNIEDNISCFLKLYPLHENWWECKAK